jgi:DNA-damage-inducible protein D
VTEDQIVEAHHKTFEEIRLLDENGNEYWLARDMARALEYAEFRNFGPVLEKAMEAADNSGHNKFDHFVEIHVMIDLGKGAKRTLPDLKLSRYACYLIMQNADPSKQIVALGQTYFAIQTRRQELADQKMAALLDEDDKRLHLRAEIAHHNKDLASAAQDSGVRQPFFGIFQDEGYKGLYGGLGSKAIHARKRLKPSQKILDHMGSTELAANFFRVTQTADKLRRENIQGEAAAGKTHHDVGRKVRQTIKELGGTMPEDLPVPEKSIGQLETAKKKKISKSS